MIHEQADVTIKDGMSLGARILIGLFAALFGITMLLIAPPGADVRAISFYMFGAFCLLIAIACFTKGRARQFVGSVVGSTIFLVGIAYLSIELADGDLWSVRPGGSSAFGALLYLVFIGYPGVSYAYRTGFGFRKTTK